MAQLHSLVGEFETRFQDFKNLGPLFNIPSSPFTAEATEDLQAKNYDLKEKFKSVVIIH